MKQMSFKHQQGASVTGVVLFIICLGLLAKLGVGIIPAYIDNKQFNQFVQDELIKANGAKQTEKQFLSSLSKQLSINADYNTKPEEMITFTNKNPGKLAVRTNYTKESVFYGNTFIVNRFSADITNTEITILEPTANGQ